MSKIIFRPVFAMIIGFGLFASQVQALERSIDCDNGQSIQKALDTAPSASGDIFYIQFDGTCEEIVTIRRDNTRIDGGGTGTISGTVRVFSAEGVWLMNLTVTGPGVGVFVSGGDAVLSGANITENLLDGIWIRRNSRVWARAETYVGQNGNSGVFIDASTIQAQNVTFEGNSIDGILAVNGSRVALGNSRVSANQGAGVALTLHSILDIRSGSTFAGNGGHGVHARLDSGIWISQPNVEFTESIYCEDYESSFHTDHDWPSGPVYCSNFQY